MNCLIVISATDSVGRAHVELDPFADAGGIAEDWQGLAAIQGVSQAEVKRRAYRMYAASVEAAGTIPPAKETIYLSAEEVEAQLEKERRAGKKTKEEKAAKKAAKAEVK